MARANRHFIPEYVWHLTHRYHILDSLLDAICLMGNGHCI